MRSEHGYSIPRLTRVHDGRFRPDDPCPYGQCEDNGWVLGEDNQARPCECLSHRQTAAAAGSLTRALPKRFRDVAFEREPVVGMERHIVAGVRMFCDTIAARLDQGESIGFVGRYGTGKTTLAMLVSKHALAARRAVLVYTLPELLNEIRDTYDERTGLTYTALIRRLTEVDLLHIEDMAVVDQPNPWVLEQLYTIINARYQEERSVCVTADVDDLPELESAVGARTASRLTEMIGGMCFPVPGEDHRLPPGHTWDSVRERRAEAAARRAEIEAERRKAADQRGRKAAHDELSSSRTPGGW